MGDIVEIKEPEKKETNSEDVETEVLEEDEPKFVCGVVISQLPDGKGMIISSIEHKDYNRRATNDDIIAMVNSAQVIISAGVTAGNVMKGIENYKEMRRGMNKLGMQ